MKAGKKCRGRQSSLRGGDKECDPHPGSQFLLRRKDDVPKDPGVLEEGIFVTRVDHVVLRLPDEHFFLGSKLPTLPNQRQQVWGDKCVPISPWRQIGLLLDHRRDRITQVG